MPHSLKVPVRVGIIGKRGHASRLIKIIQTRKDVHLAVVYTPHRPGPDESGLPYTQNFSDLLACQAIVIASPTPTHAGYLDRLKRYPGYLFLEKPAVSTPAQTRTLRRWSTNRKARVQVNFNMRYGQWAKVLAKTARDSRLGRVLGLNVHTSHGLAFTKGYRNSWRSRTGASYGVMETVGVHYINLALHLFGPIVDSDAVLRRVSGKNGPADFGILRLRHLNGVLTLLRHSYAAPLLNRFSLLGTNGYWEYDGKQATLFSPRDTFDRRGYFAPPPLRQKWNIDLEKSDQDSWRVALDDFITRVKHNRPFAVNDFTLALDSMEPLFRMRM